MVASGVPNENENRHVFEISEVALEFREVKVFCSAAAKIYFSHLTTTK